MEKATAWRKLGGMEKATASSAAAGRIQPASVAASSRPPFPLCAGSKGPRHPAPSRLSSSSSAGSTTSNAVPPLRAAATGATGASPRPQYPAMRPPAPNQEEPRPENPHLLLGAPKLSLGCPLLNRLLSGGLPAASVTEIVGESASGKTQLCLQLALLPPLLSSSSSLFLCSDLPFPLRRLRLLAPYLELLDHVFVAAIYSPTHLLSLLSRAQHHLSHPSSTHPIRLILIDSIASLFRGADFGDSPANLKRRSELFFKISSKLKELAYRHQCVVVVTNQVVDVFEGNLVHNTVAWSSGRKVSPALGLTWANCVNTRLFLTKEVGRDGGIIRRHMKVAFAPHLPEQICEFVIGTDGVFGKGQSQNNDEYMSDDEYISDDDEYIDPEDDYMEPDDDDYFSDQDDL